MSQWPKTAFVVLLGAALLVISFLGVIVSYQEGQLKELRQNLSAALDMAEEFRTQAKDCAGTMEKKISAALGRLDTFVVTAYEPGPRSCAPHDDGVTAFGLVAHPKHNIVAIDPSVIPPLKKVWIEGMGVFTAADVGGKIKGKRVDILMASVRDAVKFGVKNMVVTWW